MISDYVFSEEGEDFLQEFCARFDVSFRLDEPGEDLVFDEVDRTFKIPEWETVDGLKAKVKESLEQGENLLSKRYKDYAVVYDKKVFWQKSH